MLRKRGYEILQELGKGSFGQALLVRRADCNIQFVAKVQPYSHLSEQDRAALVREVRHMHQLSTYHHPHLVRFRQSFRDETELFIIMDYYEEPDLASQIQAQRQAGQQFGEAVVQRWLYEIVSGLDYLHFCRFLHRDIKPANIFMSRGSALLGDLGMSKEVSTGVTGVHLHTQCGSPLYIAPEVHMGQPYSKSVDIWSLGCTLFEVMMLDYAFRGATLADIMRGIIHAQHQEITGSWSDRLVHILESMLLLRARDRPQTMNLVSDNYFFAVVSHPTWDVKALRHRFFPGPDGSPQLTD